MKRVRIGPVAEAVLGVIAVAGIVSIAVCAPNALQVLKPFFKEKKYSPRASITRNIESLIKSGLVKRTYSKDGDGRLELTRKGRWEVGIRSVLVGQKEMKWDGKWRVVIFDVPNTKTKMRIELTRGMRMYGFELLQKSAWIYPYECNDFVEILRDHLDLRENVTHLVTDRFHGDEVYRKKFRI
ncbi:MAG: hypothetical protein NUW00_02590 [Candidatus Kaiserbacteria bacterium]|nr:hypothetical protein [Candidatus Kaiserbacteria bacterium]